MQPYHFSYTLCWQSGGADVKLSENRVIATRVGARLAFPDARQFVIDFAGPKLDAVPENEPPLAIANCSANAAIVDNQVFRNPFVNAWRVMLKMSPSPATPTRWISGARCKKETNTLSETWTYQWSPP